jgi:precorrin-3B synthase
VSAADFDPDGDAGSPPVRSEAALQFGIRTPHRVAARQPLPAARPCSGISAGAVAQLPLPVMVGEGRPSTDFVISAPQPTDSLPAPTATLRRECVLDNGASQHTLRGWCPGALRPMESGDGLIVRLKVTGGIVDVLLAERIAGWSSRWGNGLIDLSSRGNLQLRGLSFQHLPALHEALTEAGLLDDSEAGEAARNVVSSPLAGLDPAAVLDARPIVKSLEQRLATDASLHILPGKFGFAVDDGGLLGLAAVPADVQFVARRTADGPIFAICLAGAKRDCLGPCRPDAVADVGTALARVFLSLQKPPIRRMRDLVAALGAETIAREAGLALSSVPQTDRAALPSAFLRVHSLGTAGFLGLGLPFGRVAAGDFAILASSAATMGAHDLRLTPWRAILIPVPSVGRARMLSAKLDRRSFILDPEDPRRRIAACPGAPSCERSTTNVRDDAAHLAATFAGAPGSDSVIHISGCSKGCAHPRPAAVTLVGRDGRYDLVRNDVASGSPAERGLTLAQAMERMRGGAP